MPKMMMMFFCIHGAVITLDLPWQHCGLEPPRSGQLQPLLPPERLSLIDQANSDSRPPFHVLEGDPQRRRFQCPFSSFRFCPLEAFAGSRERG